MSAFATPTTGEGSGPHSEELRMQIGGLRDDAVRAAVVDSERRADMLRRR